MGRVQETSGMKMRGQVRPQSGGDGAPSSSSKRRKTHENEKASKEPGPALPPAEPPTPSKDRRGWTQEEEMDLVKVLQEHKRAGKPIPLQSKTAPYWTDLISMVYPGEKGITQRRLYDKARRMLQRYNEILEKKTSFRNAHEKSLFQFWEKIFVDEINTKKAVQETVTEKQVSNGNPVKLVEVSDSEEEDDDEEEHEQQVPTAKDTSKAGPSAQESSGSEEEDEDDVEVNEGDSGQNNARAKAALGAQLELSKRNFLPEEASRKAGSESGFKQSGGNEKENFATERSPNVENGKRRSKAGAKQARLEVEMIRSIKVEVFEWLEKLRKDCMRELDEVKGLLVSPARVQLAMRHKELMLEEFSLQEKELEISQRFCRLQKEALKLRSAT